MTRNMLIRSTVACTLLFLMSTSWAQTTQQSIGMADVSFNAQVEADCRVCHYPNAGGQSEDDFDIDTHHGKVGDSLDNGGQITVPNRDTDMDGNEDSGYSCMSCHSGGGQGGFAIVRDCVSCHTGATPHHDGVSADECIECHGSIVDSPSDGHYMPQYGVSSVTPTKDDCQTCHIGADSGGIPGSNRDLHHDTGISNCTMCHSGSSDLDQMRQCETCHGAASLHDIQADSPAPPTATAPAGQIVTGQEYSGYGHRGRDVPNDSDCAGCHAGNANASLASLSGPITPSLRAASPVSMKAGTATLVSLTGAALTNITNDVLFESDAVLTASDGSSVTLKPSQIVEGYMKITIPDTVAPGNYLIRAVKLDEQGDSVSSSNPVRIAIVPEVIITDVTVGDGVMVIEGMGFSGYAEGSGTSVTGTNGASIVEATIVSWSDTVIEADFGASAQEVSLSAVTVNSVFGADTFEAEAVSR
ncbi:MAG: hypothetical protein GY809_33430 [Planctomycetes bacterium]|nr:hypothetical protein [Planctomycetota bacterium]